MEEDEESEAIEGTKPLPTHLQKLIDMLPRRRTGKPEDLDGLLLLLAADEAHFINGAVITADDGMTAL